MVVGIKGKNMDSKRQEKNRYGVLYNKNGD